MRYAICFLAIVVAGCANTVPVDNTKPGPSVVDKLDSSAVFNALADAVEHKTCKTSKKLGRLVEVLQRNNAIDDSAVKTFDGAFDISKERDLTSEDATKLRGLK